MMMRFKSLNNMSSSNNQKGKYKLMTTPTTPKKTKFYTVVFMNSRGNIPEFVRRYKSLTSAKKAIADSDKLAWLVKTDNRPTHSKKQTVVEAVPHNEVVELPTASEEIFQEVLEDEPDETIISANTEVVLATEKPKVRMPMMAQDNHVGSSKLDVELDVTAKPKQLNFFSTIFGK